MIRELEYCIAPETALDAAAEFSNRLGDRVRPIGAHYIDSQQRREKCTESFLRAYKQEYTQQDVKTS